MAKTLSEHAAYELTKAGLANSDEQEARQVAINTMALIRRFEKQKNTEKQKDFILEALNRLLNSQPLTQLTDDPSEWEKFELNRKNMETGEEETKIAWQSKRASSIFSYDEGKTWIDQQTGKTGDSVDHIKLAKDMEQDEARRKAAKERAKTPVPNPAGHVSPDIPPGEAVITQPKNVNESTNSVDNTKSEVNENKK